MTIKHPKDSSQASKSFDAKPNQTDMSQQIPYSSSNSLHNRPRKRISWSLTIAIIGLIVLILVVLYNHFSNTTSVDTSQTESMDKVVTTSEVVEQSPTLHSITTTDDSSEEANDSSGNLKNEVPIGFESNLDNIPTPDEILSAPIPESDLLVKEEIQRLGDEEQRLKEQKLLLEEQVEIMDELNKKKEDQVALLEQQIAQLERLSKSQ